MNGTVSRFLLLLLLICGTLCAEGATVRQSDIEPGHLPNPLAGEVPLRFERVSLDDGLSQGSIFAILQDGQGFMWFGTEDGLNRYDGYSFTVYKAIPFDSTSLSTSLIRSLYEDRQGVLWVGTGGGGLNRMDRSTGTFEQFRHIPEDTTSLSNNIVSVIYEDAGGTLWVGTGGGGLNRMDRSTGTFEQFRHIPEDTTSLSNNIVTGIYEDPTGVLWVATANGLNRMDRATGTFRRYFHGPGQPNRYNERHPEGIVTTFLHADPQDPGYLWLTTGQGLVHLNTETGTYRRYLPEEGLSVNNIFVDAAVDPTDPAVFWIVSNVSGLYRFDARTGSFKNYRHRPHDQASLSTDHLSTIYVDRSGSVWAGSAVGKGLNRFDPSVGSFALYQHVPGDPNSLSPGLVWSVYEAPSEPGVLWIGTAGDAAFASGTLHRFDREKGVITRWTHDPENPTSLGAGTVGAILEDREGVLWVGTWGGGLNRMDRKTGRFLRYRHDPDDDNTLGSNVVYTIYEDREGVLWIGTAGGGLNRMDRQAGTFVRYRYDPEDSTSISSNIVRVLLEDRQGRFWVGTMGGGLNVMDRQSGTFERIRHDPAMRNSLSDDRVLALHERAREPGVLWIGTYGGGLNRFDTDSGTFTHYTEGDGLPNNAVYGILEDTDGHLWLSTNNGIVRFDPGTETFVRYDLDRGLQSREFNAGAHFAGSQGELFFGGPNGVNAFYPHQVGSNPNPPEVVVTNVRLFQQSVAPGADVDFRPAMDGSDELVFAHFEKDLVFEYVGLHYSRPEQNRYRYILEGYDSEWTEAGNRRMAVYTNLDPGVYTFRVRAANADGVWSPEGASIRIRIRPPWWRTWWAYGLYAVALGAGIFVVDRVQRRRLILREREAAQIRENRLRAEAAEARARALQAENERKTQELESARQLQLSLLPRELPRLPHVDVAAYMQTATEVGGDYYDFNVGDDGTLTIVIGDATGHGMQAGAMVTATKSVLNVLSEEQHLGRLLLRSTEALKRMGLPRLFMALALARLRGYTLEFAGAGMPPALIYRSDTRQVETASLRGMPLGGPSGFPYEVASVVLRPGDTVLFMSDGFPELFNEEGEMLGYDRMIPVFERAACGAPEDIIEHFKQVANQWSNGQGQNDDITFVVLKMKDGGAS